jgi:hypothetical protein
MFVAYITNATRYIERRSTIVVTVAFNFLDPSNAADLVSQRSVKSHCHSLRYQGSKGTRNA